VPVGCRRSRWGRPSLEPLFRLAETVLVPPFKLWFNWRMEGLERVPREGPVLVAGNHISYLDPFAHAYFLVRAGRRPRFLAKQELFEVRLVGRALRALGQIPVRRGTGDRSPLEAAEAALRAGETVLVYPEGTVTKNPDFSPMAGRTGIVRLALRTGLPVLPVATWGGQHVWQKSGRQSLRFARPIWLAAGPPVDLSGYAGGVDDGDALRAATEDVMGALAVIVEDLRSRYPKRWAPAG
jgi:1-acyl-sn-glycerol-3-phosphate acyltransferase